MASIVMAAPRAQQPVVTETVTDGGMRIWRFPSDGGDRFRIAVLIGVGARDEPTGERGIAHYLEHVVFARTESRPKAAADDELAARGIAFNGYTSHEDTVYHLDGDADDWPFAVAWLADHVVHPAFADEDVAVERRIVQQELATQAPDAQDVTDESLFYPDQPLGRSIGGTPADVAGLDGASLRRFYRAHYRAGDVAVGFAGRVPREACVAAIESAFAALPAGEPSLGPPVVQPRGGAIVPFAGGAMARDGWLHAGYHLPANGVQDLAIARVIEMVLERRWFDELREKRQIAYSPVTDLVTYRDTQRLELGVEVADRRDLGTALDLVHDLTAELQDVDPILLANARRRALAVLQVGSTHELTEAMELAWLLRLHAASPNDFADAVAAATTSDVAAFASRCLDDEHAFAVTSAPVGPALTPWLAMLLLPVVLLLLDGLGSFARTRALARRVGRLWQRPAPRRRTPTPPATRVSGDDLERSIQAWFEEQERPR